MTDTVTRETHLPSGAAETWAAVSSPDGLARWLVDAADLDPRPGGEARFVVDGEPREGWVEEATEPGAMGEGRFVFWWARAGAAASRVAIVVAEDPDGGTWVRVSESRPLESLHLIGRAVPGGGAHGPALIAA